MKIKHFWRYLSPRVCQSSLSASTIIFPWPNDYFFIYLSWSGSTNSSALGFILLLLGNTFLLQIKQAYRSLYLTLLWIVISLTHKLYSGQSRKHIFGHITFWLSSNLTSGWHVVWVNNLQNTASCTTRIHWEGHCFYLDIHHLYVCLAGFVCYVYILRASRELQWLGRKLKEVLAHT